MRDRRVRNEMVNPGGTLADGQQNNQQAALQNAQQQNDGNNNQQNGQSLDLRGLSEEQIQ